MKKACHKTSAFCLLPSAFSLIEVLVSMAVMVVIIVLVTNMFRDASEAWDIGTQRADMNTSARAAIEYISRELSCAVAGSVPASTGGVAVVKHFMLGSGADYNVTNLSFTALSSENHALRGVRFGYDPADGIIVTTNETANFKPYDPAWNSSWGRCLLITNVWSFKVNVCSNESQMAAGAIGWNYDSSDNSNLLPACVDITIEMLGERDMARALSLSGAAQEGYVMTNSRVYTTRVCFPNRGGGGK